MESCRRCGAALGPSQRFCTACGTPADAPTPPPEANETVVLPPPGGAWAPPNQDATTTTAAPPGDAGQPTFVAPAPLPPSGAPVGGAAPRSAREPRGRGKAILLVGGVLALAAVGFLFVRGLTGSGGGADSPEDAAKALASALDHEDPAAAASAVVPEEVRSLGDVFDAIEGRAQEVGIAPKSKPYAGIDIKVEDLEFDVDQLSDDVAKVTVRDGSVSYKVKESDLSEDAKAIAEREELDTSGKLDASDFDDEDSSLNIDSDPYLIAVKRSGGWYISLAYTAAEYYATGADLPEGRFDPTPTDTKPAATPEGAVEQFADAVGNVDLDAVAEASDPGEWSVLDVYRRTFEEALERQQDQGNLNGVDFKVSDSDLKVEDLGKDAKKVVVEKASGKVSWDGYDGTESREWRFDGSCLEIDDEESGCIRGDAGTWKTLGFDQAYVVTVKVDGGWVVSPTATVVALAQEVVPKITRNIVLDFFGHPELAEPSGALDSGKATTVKLNEAGFATMTLTPSEATSYAITSDDGWIDIVDADGEWADYDWPGGVQIYALDKQPYTVVLYPSEEGIDEVEVRLTKVEREALPSGVLDGDELSGSLSPEEPVAEYAFEVDEDVTISLGDAIGDVEAVIFTDDGEDDGGTCWSGGPCNLVAGESYVLQLSLWDESSDADYAVTFRGGAGDGGTDAGTITGPTSSSGFLEDGERVSFLVSPTDDLWVDVGSSDPDVDMDCYVDGSSYEAGGPESIFVLADNPTYVECFPYEGGAASYQIFAYYD